MKKIIGIICVLIIIATLTACGNMSFGAGNYDFNIVHVCDHSGNCADYEVEKWYEDDCGIEVKLKDGNCLYLSEGTYILASDHCPICGEDAEAALKGAAANE